MGLNADFHLRNFFESFWGNNEMLQNNSFRHLDWLYKIWKKQKDLYMDEILLLLSSFLF